MNEETEAPRGGTDFPGLVVTGKAKRRISFSMVTWSLEMSRDMGWPYLAYCQLMRFSVTSYR